MVQSRQHTRDRLADVEATLLDWIASARFAPGDKIPTERELSRILSQPRHVVRTAILELTSRGLLVRHVGRGTHVVAADSPGTTKPATFTAPNGDQVTLAGILETRLLFEPALARLAIARASQTDLHRLERCARAIEEAQFIDELECAEADIAVAMAEMADNPLLNGMVGLLAASWSSHARARGAQIAAPTDRRASVSAVAQELIAAFRMLDADRAADVIRSYLIVRLRQFSGFALAEGSRAGDSMVEKGDQAT
jgi:DNA-binding FadR family transcriptional regulator